MTASFQSGRCFKSHRREHNVTKNSGMKLYWHGMIEEIALSNVTRPHLAFSAERLCYSPCGSMARKYKAKTQKFTVPAFKQWLMWKRCSFWTLPAIDLNESLHILEHFWYFYIKLSTKTHFVYVALKANMVVIALHY